MVQERSAQEGIEYVVANTCARLPMKVGAVQHQLQIELVGYGITEEAIQDYMGEVTPSGNGWIWEHEEDAFRKKALDEANMDILLADVANN